MGQSPPRKLTFTQMLQVTLKKIFFVVPLPHKIIYPRQEVCVCECHSDHQPSDVMKKKKMAGIHYQQYVLTPPSSGSFFPPIPPLPFLYFGTEVLSFSQSHFLSVCLQTNSYFTTTTFSLSTSLSFHHHAFAFLSSSVVCWHGRPSRFASSLALFHSFASCDSQLQLLW